MSETYEIKLPQFEGPFDLLLFFIERDEIDINDIPIAKLSNDFLAYIQQMQALNIELASEFILVAATLMRIKAKMLIPRKELDEHGNPIDPRQELADRLLEYKKYKAASDLLLKLHEARYEMHKRGNLQIEINAISDSFSGEMDLQSLTLYRLLKAFESVLDRKRFQEPVVHKINPYNYTLEDLKTDIFITLANTEQVSFVQLFDKCENRVHAVFMFLAMLELIQLQQLTLVPGLGINNFWVQRNEHEQENVESNEIS